MKKLLLIALTTMLVLMNCGSDGADGNAYIAFDWDSYVDSYSDDNDNTPSTISRNEYYKSEPGTYNFLYYCSDGTGDEWYWSGTYTLIVEEGEEGGLIKNGDDGEDLYCTLEMYGLTGVVLSKEVSINKEKKDLLTKPLITNTENFEKSGEPVLDTFSNGYYSVIVEKQLYQKREIVVQLVPG